MSVGISRVVKFSLGETRHRGSGIRVEDVAPNFVLRRSGIKTIKTGFAQNFQKQVCTVGEKFCNLCKTLFRSVSLQTF